MIGMRPHIPRAPRYPILIPVLYRATGYGPWHEGRTENISRSGVLFRVDEAMNVETPIEMLVMFPPEVVGDAAGTTMCRGRIVRRIDPCPVDPRPGLAVAIHEYEPVHPPDPRRI